MADKTVKTIRADELPLNDTPDLIAMGYNTEIGYTVLSTAGMDSAVSDSSFDGVALVLVFSFVAVVTVSRRSLKDLVVRYGRRFYR